MAPHPKASLERTSSSPPAVLAELRRPGPLQKRLFCIPSAQKKLLDDASAWAAVLYTRPKGPVNVPADVLGDLEKHHKRLRKQTRPPTQPTAPAASQSNGSREDEAVRRDDSAKDDSNVEVEAHDDTDDENSEDEREGTAIPWTSSPPEHLQPKQQHKEVTPPPRDDSQPLEEVREATPGLRYDTQPPEVREATSEPRYETQPPEVREATPEPRRESSVGRVPVTQRQPSEAPASPSEASHPQRNASPERFASQLPLSSPCRSATGAPNPVQKRPTFNNFHPSSSSPEEELEVVAPAPFVRVAPAGGNRSALDPTPPSAQVQVPCTAGCEPDSPVAVRPKKPKSGNTSRYKRPDVKELLTSEIPRPVPAATSGLRRPPAQARLTHDAPDSSMSDDLVSSSIVRSSHQGVPRSTPAKTMTNASTKTPQSKTIVKETQIPAQQSSSGADSSPGRLPELRPPSPVVARSATFRPEAISPVVQRIQLEISVTSAPGTGMVQYQPAQQQPYLMPATLPSTSSPGTPLIQTLPTQQSLPPIPHAATPPTATPQAATPWTSTDRTLPPFLQYALAYPSYTGSVGDFVNACYLIQRLQRKRALASYSYDDFIRAWRDGYIPYVAEFYGPMNQGRAEEPMTSIEWYMESVRQLEFTSGVVTKENLESILAVYPDEVLSARRSGLGSSSQESLPKVTPPRPQPQAHVPPVSSRAQEKQPASQPPMPPNVEQVLSVAHGCGETIDDQAMELERAEEAISTHGPQRQSQSDPIERTTRDEPVSLPRQGLLRNSASERNSRKRDASDDDVSPAPKKMLRRPGPEPTFISSTSKASAHQTSSGRSSFSGTPRSTGYKGPKKYVNDLAKRRESLQKHFAKAMGKRPRDSIVSSSWGASSTPPPGRSG